MRLVNAELVNEQNGCASGKLNTMLDENWLVFY